MSVHAFPVRFAETVNRFGAARAERAGTTPSAARSALVTIGERTFMARIHSERVTRRGRQSLVSVHGRLTWVASSRVQPIGQEQGLSA